MNFISTFEELNKLYEEAQKKEKVVEPVEEACSKENDNEVKEGIIGDTISGGVRGAAKGFLGINEDVDEENVDEEDVAEIPEEEEEIEVVDDEPKQVILECDKCGALVIKNDEELVVDDESDLVNVEDACEYCEETAGYKILGAVAPYGAEEEEPIEEGLGGKAVGAALGAASGAGAVGALVGGAVGSHIQDKLSEEADDEAVEEGLGGAVVGGALGAAAGKGIIGKAVGTAAGAAAGSYVQNKLSEEADDEELIDEDLGDIFRKTFDKPASVKKQQAWEDELNGECGEVSDKRRKQLEKKFAQQRDWEARHPGEAVK